jgi:hypothetical protein
VAVGVVCFTRRVSILQVLRNGIDVIEEVVVAAAAETVEAGITTDIARQSQKLAGWLQHANPIGDMAVPTRKCTIHTAALLERTTVG